MALNMPRSTAHAPTLAWILGVVALIPFVVGSYIALTGTSDWAARTLAWLIVYTATIVSFIGGIQWGLQIAWERARIVDMCAAACPALIAWIGVMWGEPWSFAFVAVALVVAWLADENGRIQGWMPRNLLILRRVLTLLVAACLAIVGGAVLFG